MPQYTIGFSREALGEFNGGLMCKPSQHHVFQFA